MIDATLRFVKVGGCVYEAQIGIERGGGKLKHFKAGLRRSFGSVGALHRVTVVEARKTPAEWRH